ncbi:hypothetical protein [Paractinoplanes durhamensis]|uniref:hypothetical protein n=1 Tax=Paractinoplanes durhamensis TaxID=113563 RepID=UPI00363C1F4E
MGGQEHEQPAAEEGLVVGDQNVNVGRAGIGNHEHASLVPLIYWRPPLWTK